MKTHDSTYADMTDNDASGIQVVVTSAYGETCSTKPLNNVGENNWIKDQVDYFNDQAMLDQCYNFRVPGHVSSTILFYSSSSACDLNFIF